MGIFVSLMMFLSMLASGVQAKSNSPSLSYWEEKLPNTPIPNTLRALIVPQNMEDEKAAVHVGVGKGGVDVSVQGKPPRKTGLPPPKPQAMPQPKPGGGKGVGVHVKPLVKGGGGVVVSVHTPGVGVGVHVGTKSPFAYKSTTTPPTPRCSRILRCRCSFSRKIYTLAPKCRSTSSRDRNLRRRIFLHVIWPTKFRSRPTSSRWPWRISTFWKVRRRR